jgi:hypothetical protein
MWRSLLLEVITRLSTYLRSFLGKVRVCVCAAC